MLHNIDPAALILLVFTALGVISHNAPVTIKPSSPVTCRG